MARELRHIACHVPDTIINLVARRSKITAKLILHVILNAREKPSIISKRILFFYLPFHPFVVIPSMSERYSILTAYIYYMRVHTFVCPLILPIRGEKRSIIINYKIVILLASVFIY
jgi:hypothetical protein